jgi:hypothetical protein
VPHLPALLLLVAQNGPTNARLHHHHDGCGLTMSDNPQSFFEELDLLHFSYKAWEEDYEVAKNSTSTLTFRDAVHRLNEKQKVHEGDRSHPRLVALDKLSSELTYPGCEDDIQNAEKAHFDNFYDSTRDDYFQSKLEGLRNRQQLYYGYSSHSDFSDRSSGNSNNQEIAAILGPCVICGERIKTHLFDPCGHLCACQSCGDEVMRQPRSSCPICRVPSAKVIRVFFS